MVKKIEQYLTEYGYIPLDKSWVIRMGVLDLLNGHTKDSIAFLEKQGELNEDLQALKQALNDWVSNRPIHVGESATLYRFLRFASWKLSQDREFIKERTLQNRKICDNVEIVNYPLKELLKLDSGTSQWASAAVLCGSQERVDNPPFKLMVTYEAVKHWKEQRQKKQTWAPRYDETILKQALAFLELFNKRKTTFIPAQSEDYCFARTFGFITKEEGESRWPSLAGHESNRFEEMEKVLEQTDKEIDSTDHRVVQAYAMLQKLKGRNITVKHPESVSKSWPQFWKFLDDSENMHI